MGDLPKFLCIGAQKAGTTWLHNMLRQNPKIFLPAIKELHFFDVERNFERGRQWYAQHFSGADPSQAVGEVTPGYLWASQVSVDGKPLSRAINWFRAETPARVYRLLGKDVKLIVLLRDPVDRAVSAYFHHMGRGRVDRNESILAAGRRHGIIQMGFYSRHLSRWLDVFGRDNLWIGFYEEVLFEPKAWLPSIERFIGVEANTETVNSRQVYNQRLRYETREDGIYLTFTPGIVKRPTRVILAKEIEQLHDRYHGDVKELARMIDRPLPWPRFTN